MNIKIRGARENNLKGVNVDIGDGLTAVTGISGSGKTSLVFDTLYHEAQRRFMEVYSRGSSITRMNPARVERIEGLGPAVAVGQNLLNRNPGSTLASASGLHPFFRLVYAHFGQRVCARCGQAITYYSKEDTANRLVSIAAGKTTSLSIPLVNQVVGSHTFLLNQLAGEYGASKLEVDGEIWQGQSLRVDLPHSIRVFGRVLEFGLTLKDARRLIDEATSMGALAICVGEEMISFTPICRFCGSWIGELRPQDFHRNCAACGGNGCTTCGGTGLAPVAAGVRWNGKNFRGFLAQSVDECTEQIHSEELPSRRLHAEIIRRLDALQKVGLGYLTLDRPSPSLSRGEAQRVRLALTLVSRLEDLVHILDEPTVGQHSADVERLLPIFRELAGPVVFVEHDRGAVAKADRVIDIGPLAGNEGGEIVFTGTPAGLWKSDTLSGKWFSMQQVQAKRRPKPYAEKFLIIQGASLHNLLNLDVKIPLGRLTVVSGVSGSGKSTLVEDVLAASCQARRPVGCRSLEGPELQVVLVDQNPIGKNPRSNPATYTKLADMVRDLFAGATGLSASHFSFNRPEGACPGCEGLGAVEISMRYLPSTWIRCEQCEGRRFSEQVLNSKMWMAGKQYSIADIFDLPIRDVLPLIRAESGLSSVDKAASIGILEALEDIGLGYLSLGQPSPSLSGGEAQRIKLARYLGKRSLSGKLLILDEPSTGLHPYDLAGLLNVFDRLTRFGATIVVVEHHLDVLRAADWIIDLGPGAGPEGGKLLYEGPVEGLVGMSNSATGVALSDEGNVKPREFASTQAVQKNDAIQIRGANANNLRSVDIDFPKGKLTVVSGLSGSGKSSLVSDVLEGEARRRYLETLSMYERQGAHEDREVDVDRVSGLGVTLRAAPERLAYSRRSTVGILTEISYQLAGLLAVLGERSCLTCNSDMRRDQTGWLCPNCGAQSALALPQHFLTNTYASACLKCHGVGTFQVPNPEKLIIAPQKPLCAGAMYSPGFFPDGYLGQPGNGGYDQVQALGRYYGFDPHQTPWNEMSSQSQQAFLFGTSEELEVIYHGRTGRTTTRRGKFPGFYGFIRDWDVGGTYTDHVNCPECGGARLRAEYLAVTLAGLNIHQLSQITLSELIQHCTNLPVEQRQEQLVSTNLSMLRKRLNFLNQVGLGYLNLLRPAGTLSAGEVQRIRLAGLLGSDLTALTILLDEPTRGLHPAEVDALGNVLLELRDSGNTIVVVEHDLEIIRLADRLVEMGPGAGSRGGEVVAQGTPLEVSQSASVTSAWLRGDQSPFPKSERRKPLRWMTLKGARANNLRGEDVAFPLNVLTGVCGLSGSGKSTLVMDTLGRILAPRKQTTSVAYEPLEPGENNGIEGAPARTILVDQSRSGVSLPANWLGITDPLQEIYSESLDAHSMGLTVKDLAARCPNCAGRGNITIDMAFLPDLNEACDACRGTGYLAEAWNVKLKGIALPDAFGLTLEEVYELFGSDVRIANPLKIAIDVGLGYLVLRQPGHTLSGGEVQRLKIAQELCKKSPRASLYILDEPTIGQHLEDVRRLITVLDRLVDAGGSVLVVEHHPHLLASCDWLIELGPGGGPHGGQIIAQGTPDELANGNTPISPYLRGVLKGKA